MTFNFTIMNDETNNLKFKGNTLAEKTILSVIAVTKFC